MDISLGIVLYNLDRIISKGFHHFTNGDECPGLRIKECPKQYISQANIWSVGCAQAAAFIFDSHTDVLVKVSKFWERKCLGLRGTRTSNFRIQAECSDHLSYQCQIFVVPCFWILALNIFVVKLNVNCVQATAFIVDSRTDILVEMSKVLR